MCFTKKEFCLFLCLLLPSLAHAQTTDNRYDYDDDAFSWNEESYNVVHVDIDSDGTLDLFLQPLEANQQFIVVYGETGNDVTHPYKNAVTFSSMTNNGYTDWSANAMTLTFGEFNGDNLPDVLGFESATGDVYFIPGAANGFNFSHTLPMSNELFPFSRDVSLYTVVAGDANGDNIDDLFAFARFKKNASNDKLHHFIVMSDETNVAAEMAAEEQRLIKLGLPIALSTKQQLNNKERFKSKKIGKIFVEDFTGDGLVDVFVQGAKNNHGLHFYASTPEGQMDFEAGVEFDGKLEDKKWSAKHAILVPSDIDSDGVLELVRYPKEESEQSDPSLYLDLVELTAHSQTSASPQMSRLTSNEDNKASQQNIDENVGQEAPSGLVHSPHEFGVGVTLSWLAQSADSYRLEKWVSDDWQLIFHGNSTEYFDEGASEGNNRYRHAACLEISAEHFSCNAFIESEFDVVYPPLPEEGESAQASRADTLLSSLNGTKVPDAGTESVYEIPPAPVLHPFNDNTIVGNETFRITFDEVAYTGYYLLHGSDISSPITRGRAAMRSSFFGYDINRPPGTYTFYIKGCNRTGCSEASNTLTVVVHGAPPAPHNLVSPTKVNAGESYDVRWDYAGEAYVSKSELYQNNALSVITNSVTRRASLVNGEGTYTYDVRACNLYACGPYAANSSITNVVPGILPPTAIADNLNILEDQTGNLFPLSNDLSSDGVTLRINSVGAAARGFAWLSFGNRVYYTPNKNGCSNAAYDSFTYVAEDVNDPSLNAVGVVNVYVTCTNDAPTVQSLPAVSVTEGAQSSYTYAYRVNDVENAGNLLSNVKNSSDLSLVGYHDIAISNHPTDLNQRYIQISPRAGKSGSTTITYGVTDTQNAQVTESFVFTVVSTNQPPAFGTVPTSVETSEGQASEAFSFTVSDDESLSQVTVTAESLTPSLVATSGITVANNETSQRTFSFEPASQDASGSGTIRLTATDEEQASVSVEIPFVINAVNDLPTITGPSEWFVAKNSGGIEQSYSATDSDGSDASISWQLSVEPVNGAASLSSSQGAQSNLTYTPTTDFDGQDTLQITVTDDMAGQRVMDITVNVIDGTIVEDCDYENAPNFEAAQVYVGESNVITWSDSVYTSCDVTTAATVSEGQATLEVCDTGVFKRTPLTFYTVGDELETQWSCTERDSGQPTSFTKTVDVLRLGAATLSQQE